MSRLAAAAFLALGPAGCAAQEPVRDAGAGAAGVELIRHRGEAASAVELSPQCRERLPGLIEALLAGAEPVRLLIDEERIREVMSGGALEVVFDAPRRFTTAASADTNARRVLVPLDDPYWVGGEDRPFVVVFLGDEVWGTGPYRHERGLALQRELRTCAGGGG